MLARRFSFFLLLHISFVYRSNHTFFSFFKKEKRMEIDGEITERPANKHCVSEWVSVGLLMIQYLMFLF